MQGDGGGAPEAGVGDAADRGARAVGDAVAAERGRGGHDQVIGGVLEKGVRGPADERLPEAGAVGTGLVVTGEQAVRHVRGRRERVELAQVGRVLGRRRHGRQARELADGVTEDLGDDGDDRTRDVADRVRGQGEQVPEAVEPGDHAAGVGQGGALVGRAGQDQRADAQGGVAAALRQLARHQPAAAVGDDVDHEGAGAGLGDEAQQVAGVGPRRDRDGVVVVGPDPALVAVGQRVPEVAVEPGEAGVGLHEGPVEPQQGRSAAQPGPRLGGHRRALDRVSGSEEADALGPGPPLPPGRGRSRHLAGQDVDHLPAGPAEQDPSDHADDPALARLGGEREPGHAERLAVRPRVGWEDDHRVGVRVDNDGEGDLVRPHRDLERVRQPAAVTLGRLPLPLPPDLEPLGREGVEPHRRSGPGAARTARVRHHPAPEVGRQSCRKRSSDSRPGSGGVPTPWMTQTLVHVRT